MAKNYRKFHYFVIIMLLVFCFSVQISFAQSNNESDSSFSLDDSYQVIEVPEVDGNKLKADNIDNSNLINDSKINNELNEKDSFDSNGDNDKLSSSPDFTILIVSDNPGTNILDISCKELFDENPNLANVNIQVRSGIQIKEMSENDFIELLSNCDVFIGEWVSTDVDAVLTSALSKYPD